MSRAELADELKQGIKQTLEKHGITEEYLALKLKRELNAKETKFFQFQGEVVTEKNVVAWDVRQRARMDAHKLRGDYPADKHELTGADGGPIEYTDTERAARLNRLIEIALKRKKVGSDSPEMASNGGDNA